MFCIECGNKLTEKDKFCPNCGKVNKDYKEETIIEKKSFCPECGRPLTENDKFCINCGKKNNDYVEKESENNIESGEVVQNAQPEVTEEVKPVEEEVTPVEEIPATEPVTETVDQVVEDVPAAEETPVVSIDNQVETVEPAPIETPVVKEDKPKKKKSKKIFFIIPAVLLIVAALIFVYFKFIKKDDSSSYKTDYISWDYDSDIKLERTFQNKLNVAVKVTPSDNEDDIEYITNCGKVRSLGQTAEWDLTKASGKCTLIAKFRSEIIVKHLYVNPLNDDVDLGSDYEIDMDSDDDLDSDGLTNKEEKEYGTNPELADTDMDGLDDKYEITESKTDPTKIDSDGDGLSDYDEIELGLDPLKEDSKGDGVKDGERDLTYTIDNDKLSLTVKGKGNIASTVSEVNANTKISGKKGLVDKLYTLYTDGKLEEATLTIKYTDAELAEYGLNEDNLAIYYYNEKESKYEKIDSVIDKENKTVKAKLKHFSNYVLGDSNVLKTSETSQVLFVLDNSWSMYTVAQYEKYSGKKYTHNDLIGYDADGLRFILTSELVSRFTDKGYQVGLSEFRRDYANAYPIGSDKNDINEKLTQMTGKFITNTEGTDIGNALTKSLDEFKTDADNKYIIILTDGEDTSLKSKVKKIVEAANNKGIKICAIGFGEGSSNTGLSQISEETGCQFYSSGDALGLDELFEKIGAEVNDGLVDVTGDNSVDGILLADSGFLVNRDGFSFTNYISNYTDGHCYGMAMFAELYYKNLLPLSLSSKDVNDPLVYARTGYFLTLFGNNNSHISNAYDLSTTYFSSHSPLYDYKLKTNALKYIFGYDIFGETGITDPAERYELDGDTLRITSSVRKDIVDSGIYEIRTKEDNLSSSEKIERYGVDYKKREHLVLDEDKMQTSNMNKNDLQMFNAIYAMFIKQNATYFYTSGMDSNIVARNLMGIENSNYITAPAFISLLKSRLESKDAPVISADFGFGLHGINAISLAQDIDDPKIYYIGVYDNNHPGEKRYVKLECVKACVTRPNEYYNADGSSIRMTPSLDNDLEYFNK